VYFFYREYQQKQAVTKISRFTAQHGDLGQVALLQLPNLLGETFTRYLFYLIGYSRTNKCVDYWSYNRGCVRVPSEKCSAITYGNIVQSSLHSIQPAYLEPFHYHLPGKIDSHMPCEYCETSPQKLIAQAFQLHGDLYTLYFISLFWGHVFFALQHNLGTFCHGQNLK
jgi:hypothetical protein